MYNIFDEINSGTIDLSSNDTDELIMESGQDESLIMEAGGIDKINEIMTINRKVILPQGKPVGKGNLAFLYANTVQESIATMVDKTNLMDKGKYKYFYYNLFYQGKLNGKMFRFKNKKKEKIFIRVFLKVQKLFQD